MINIVSLASIKEIASSMRMVLTAPLSVSSYFHQQLLDWIVDRMNNQPDDGPMNHIASLLEQANYPKQAIISIGATRYTSSVKRISCTPMISVLLSCITVKIFC